ncbi:hypothetical protein FCV48_25140 [Vibrio alginolyticus]|nr:hypothetical protein FCV48_25140 [Vibrio alginolyticus]
MPVINPLHSELWYIHGSSLLNLLFLFPKQHRVTAILQDSIFKDCELQEPWYDHGDFTVLWSFGLTA